MQTEAILAPIMKVADNYTWLIPKMIHNPDSFMDLTRQIVAQNPEIIGSQLLLPPTILKKKDVTFRPIPIGTEILFGVSNWAMRTMSILSWIGTRFP
jgi:hypothetical protein